MNEKKKKLFTYLCNVFSASLLFSTEGEDCEIQFAESVLLPAAQAYRQDRPDYDPNYDDPDDILQFYIALDVSGNLTCVHITYNYSELNGCTIVFLIV